jgi:hypothetical protein
VPNEGAAAARARWLAEVAEALEEARQVMKQLGAVAGGIEIVELYDRIDALALDVDFMRRKRASPGGEHFRPEWTKNIPWTLSA